MDDVSYFLVIRLGPKTSECEKIVTIVSTVTGYDVTNCATTLQFKFQNLENFTITSAIFVGINCPVTPGSVAFFFAKYFECLDIPMIDGRMMAPDHMC